MKRLTLGLAAALIAIPTLAAPQFGNDTNRGIWQDLDLTEAQQSQLDTLRDTYRDQRLQARDGFRQKMGALLTQPEFDEAAATELFNAMPQHGRQMHGQGIERARHMHAMMQVLTPEQQETFLDKMHDQRRHGGWDKEKGKRGQGHHDRRGNCSR